MVSQKAREESISEGRRQQCERPHRDQGTSGWRRAIGLDKQKDYLLRDFFCVFISHIQSWITVPFLEREKDKVGKTGRDGSLFRRNLNTHLCQHSLHC